MTPKRFLGPILRTSRLLIPFYWWFHLGEKQVHPIASGIYRIKARKYYNLDDRARARRALRDDIISLCMFGTLIAAILYPLFTVTSVLFIGYGILPGIADFLINQIIRGISYWKHHKDPKIIKPSNPYKYLPFQFKNNEPTEGKGLSTKYSSENEATQRIMRALCREKEQLKQDSWCGLSGTQQDKSNALNLAIDYYRSNPYRKVYENTHVSLTHFGSLKQYKLTDTKDGFVLVQKDFDSEELIEKSIKKALDKIIEEAATPSIRPT